MTIDSATIKKLREETGAGIIDCKKALTEVGGDFKKAVALVQERGLARAEKKSDRETKQGAVFSYVHNGGKVASLIELLCETDFVARNSEFQELGKNIAMQVAAMNPSTTEELLDQEYIRESGVTIGFLVKQLTGKIGEKIMVNRIVRFEVGA